MKQQWGQIYTCSCQDKVSPNKDWAIEAVYRDIFTREELLEGHTVH